MLVAEIYDMMMGGKCRREVEEACNNSQSQRKYRILPPPDRLLILFPVQGVYVCMYERGVSQWAKKESWNMPQGTPHRILYYYYHVLSLLFF